MLSRELRQLTARLDAIWQSGNALPPFTKRARIEAAYQGMEGDTFADLAAEYRKLLAKTHTIRSTSSPKPVRSACASCTPPIRRLR